MVYMSMQGSHVLVITPGWYSACFVDTFVSLPFSALRPQIWTGPCQLCGTGGLQVCRGTLSLM